MARQKEKIEPGTVFKQWKVIREVDSVPYKYKGKIKYFRKFLCKCLKCEVNYEVAYNHLKNKNKCFCCKSCSIQKEIVEPGTVFKQWEVIMELEQRERQRYFLCKCLKCEVNYEVAYNRLKNKSKYFCCKSCAYGDLSGQKFSRLLVIEKYSQNKDGRWKYLCKCDCGEETIVAGNNLLSGMIKSCGCYKKERLRKNGGENHPNWKGGITPIIKKKRDLEKQVKQLSKQRDNYTCQKCGDNKGGNLESHHVFDFEHYQELQNNIYNFITLCRKCHQPSKKNKHSFHSIYSPRKENTLNDLETWLGHPYKYRQSLLNYYEYYYKNPSRTRNCLK